MKEQGGFQPGQPKVEGEVARKSTIELVMPQAWANDKRAASGDAARKRIFDFVTAWVAAIKKEMESSGKTAEDAAALTISSIDGYGTISANDEQLIRRALKKYWGCDVK